MRREELLTGLRLSDIDYSTALNICEVCNETITNDDKVLFITRNTSQSTWICVFCESVYDSDDNVIEIGLVDGISDIKGIA